MLALKIVSTIILSIFILFLTLAAIVIALDKDENYEGKHLFVLLIFLTSLIFVLVTLWVI